MCACDIVAGVASGLKLNLEKSQRTPINKMKVSIDFVNSKDELSSPFSSQPFVIEAKRLGDVVEAVKIGDGCRSSLYYMTDDGQWSALCMAYVWGDDKDVLKVRSFPAPYTQLHVVYIIGLFVKPRFIYFSNLEIAQCVKDAATEYAATTWSEKVGLVSEKWTTGSTPNICYTPHVSFGCDCKAIAEESKLIGKAEHNDLAFSKTSHATMFEIIKNMDANSIYCSRFDHIVYCNTTMLFLIA